MPISKRSAGAICTGLLAAVVLAAPARAQTLFFNGNPDGVDGLTSEQDLAVNQSMVYDNFVVTGSDWLVTDLYGYFQTNLNVSSAAWEIRSGISEGNGGTLVASGTSPATQTDAGYSEFDLEVYDIGIAGLSLDLAPGTYWMGISPIDIVTDGGRAFLATTSGSGSINADADQVSYWNSSSFGANFASTDGELGFQTDFSYGALGTGSPVPEPSTMALLATGLVGMAGAARRRRKA